LLRSSVPGTDLIALHTGEYGCALRKFLADDNGAVTIDWVALAAGLLILGVGMMGLLSNETQAIVDEMEVLYVQADDFDLPEEN